MLTNVADQKKHLHVSQVGDALESVDVLLGEAGQVAAGVGEGLHHLTVDEPGAQSIAKGMNGASQPGSPDNLVADVAGPAVDGGARHVLAHHVDHHLEEQG